MVRFSEFQIASSVVEVIICFVGIAGALIVLLSSPRQKLDAGLLLVYNLTAADGLFCLGTFSLVLYNLCHGGWPEDNQEQLLLKSLDFLLIAIPLFISIMTTFYINLERYLLIVRGQRLTLKSVGALVCSTWVFIIGLAAWVMSSKTITGYFIVQEAGYYAFLDVRSKEPMILAVSVMALVTMALPLLTIGFVQWRIWKKFVDLKRQKMQQKRCRDSCSEADYFGDVAQLVILVKAVTIVLLFLLCWTPMFICFIYKMATSSSLDPLVDTFAGWFAALNSSLNPYLLMLLDVQVKSNVEQLLGIKIWSVTDTIKRYLETKEAGGGGKGILSTKRVGAETLAWFAD